MHQAVDEGDVGAQAVLHGDIRQKGHLGGTGIDHDDLGAFFSAPEDPLGGDGMVFGGVGADDEDALGVGQLRDGVGHGAGTESRGQTDHGGAMSESGAVIDVVGADGGPGKFLDQVVFFVGDLGGGQHRHRVGAVFLHDLF